MNKPRLLKGWDENEAHRDQWLPLILDYQDGTLEGSELNNLKHHLETCSTCTADLDGMRESVTLLKRLPEMSVPRSFTINPVQARRLKPSPVYRFSQFAASIAAAFLIFAFTLDLSGAFTPPVAPASVAVVTADPTITLEPIGTLAAATGKAGGGSQSGLTVPNPTVAPNPTAIPQPNIQSSQVASLGPNPDFRLIEISLLIATILFTAFALMARPRAPGRLRT